MKNSCFWYVPLRRLREAAYWQTYSPGLRRAGSSKGDALQRFRVVLLLARGVLGGMLHHQSARYSTLPASLSGNQQHRRQPAFRNSQSHPASVPLASGHAGALVSSCIHGNRKIVPQDYGPSGSVRVSILQLPRRWLAQPYLLSRGEPWGTLNTQTGRVSACGERTRRMRFHSGPAGGRRGQEY